jgi:hypothetical protein
LNKGSGLVRPPLRQPLVNDVDNHFLHGEPVSPKLDRQAVEAQSVLLRSYALPDAPRRLPQAALRHQRRQWSRFDLIANQGDIEEAILTVLVSEKRYHAGKKVKSRKPNTNFSLLNCTRKLNQKANVGLLP